jgi:hypothetical protein
VILGGNALPMIFTAIYFSFFLALRIFLFSFVPARASHVVTSSQFIQSHSVPFLHCSYLDIICDFSVYIPLPSRPFASLSQYYFILFACMRCCPSLSLSLMPLPTHLLEFTTVRSSQSPAAIRCSFTWHFASILSVIYDRGSNHRLSISALQTVLAETLPSLTNAGCSSIIFNTLHSLPFIQLSQLPCARHPFARLPPSSFLSPLL